jgi:predicted amidohydrolase
MSTMARVVTTALRGIARDSVEKNRAMVLSLLDKALSRKPDIVCLPEALITTGVRLDAIEDGAETVPGPTIDEVGKRARQARCYVICPLTTAREGRIYNSAVIVDRCGDVAGLYDKAHAEYAERHRVAYRALAEGRPPEPQRAAHGRRPQCGK